MTVYEALAAVPELMLVHVSTFEVLEDEPIQIEQRKQFWVNLEQKDREKQVTEISSVDPEPQGPGNLGCRGKPPPNMKAAAQLTKKTKEDNEESNASESDEYDEGHRLIESSICRTRCLSNDEKLEPYRRFWVEMRPKQT